MEEKEILIVLEKILFVLKAGFWILSLWFGMWIGVNLFG